MIFQLPTNFKTALTHSIFTFTPQKKFCGFFNSFLTTLNFSLGFPVENPKWGRFSTPGSTKGFYFEKSFAVFGFSPPICPLSTLYSFWSWGSLVSRPQISRWSFPLNKSYSTFKFRKNIATYEDIKGDWLQTPPRGASATRGGLQNEVFVSEWRGIWRQEKFKTQ